jgi:hypothetical protein
MPGTYCCRLFTTAKYVFSAIPPRNTQVAMRKSPVSVKPARVASAA